MGTGQALLTWFDRAGQRLGTVGEAADLVGVAFSPDRHTVANNILDPVSHTYDLWLYDIAKARRTRFTFDAARLNSAVA